MTDNRSRATGAWDVIKGTARKFGAENGTLIAAAISFYAVLSVLPLLLLAVSVLGYVVGSSDQAFSTVSNAMKQFAPSSGSITDVLKGLVQQRGAIGLLGLVALLWTGSQYFMTLQTAMDDVYEVTEKPGFIKGRLKAIGLVIGFGILFALSMASGSAVRFVQGGLGGSWLIGLLGGLVGLVFSILMFTLVYKFAPDAPVSWKSALLGGLFAAIVWTIAKELYVLYLTYIAHFNKLYGSLGGIIILIIWIYYSSMILVFGAEMAYVNDHGPQDQPEEAERLGQK